MKFGPVIPMALVALATLVGVGVILVVSDLVRRAVLFLIAAVVPPSSPPAHPEADRDRGAAGPGASDAGGPTALPG